MARKKVKKTSLKKTSTKQVKKTKTPLTQIETMEKAFRDAPAKLAMQCRKDLSTLKQQEQKLKKTLKKTLDQKKTIISKLHALTTKSKTKLAAVPKKQMMSMQKTMQDLTKEITLFTTQLEQIKKHCATLVKKQKHFGMISKLISQLGKETLKKQTRKPKTKTKTTMKKAKSSTADSTTRESFTNHVDLPMTTTHSTHEPVEMDS